MPASCGRAYPRTPTEGRGNAKVYNGYIGMVTYYDEAGILF